MQVLILPTVHKLPGSSRRNMYFTYPLPNEALFPRRAQRSKVTLKETKYNSCGCVWRAPASTCPSYSQLQVGLEKVGSYFLRTIERFQPKSTNPCSKSVLTMMRSSSIRQ